MMPRCCVESFVQKGFREHFRLAEYGATHTCEVCGRVYRCDPMWREIAPEVPPLQVTEEDD